MVHAEYIATTVVSTVKYISWLVRTDFLHNRTKQVLNVVVASTALVQSNHSLKHLLKFYTPVTVHESHFRAWKMNFVID
jgi:hypothetical protein